MRSLPWLPNPFSLGPAAWLRRIGRDQRGIGVIGFGLALPALVGAAGIAVEIGLWYKHKRDLQLAADASAVAAAFELARSNEDGIVMAATAQAAKNGFALDNRTTLAVTPNTSGGVGTVVVTLTRSYPQLFSAILSDQGAVGIAANATAEVKVSGDACVLALDPQMAKALDIQGSTFVNMPSCTMAANSSDATAVAVSGSASLTAASLWTRGGIDTGGSAGITLPGGMLDHMWALADPYSGLTIPPIGTCQHNNKSYSNVTTSIGPGVYCGDLSFGANANVTLAPGTYYIIDGNLELNAQSVLRCNCSGQEGVTFVLTTVSNVSKIGRVRINGGADVQLAAPSDPNAHFVGVLIYQDRRVTSAQTNKLNGGSTMMLTGVVYAPAQLAEWTGNNGSSSSNCTRIIAKSIVFIGNSQFNNLGCSAAGVKPIEVTAVRISS